MSIISQKRADLLIAIITITWGASYLFMKMGLGSLNVFNLVALRFGIAFFVTVLIFPKRLLQINIPTLKYGALLGFTLFCVLSTLMFGLKTTTASSAGFLAGTTVIFVPVIQTLIMRKKPLLTIIVGAVLAISGIALLTIDGSFRLEASSLLCVVAAFIYAGQIILTSNLSQKADTLTLGILQLGFAGFFGLIFSLAFEKPALPNSTNAWIAVLALSIVCSAFGFALQPVAQKYTTPERTGILFALEPVFSAIFGFLFLHEMLQVRGYIGAILVLLGVFASGLTNEKIASYKNALFIKIKTLKENTDEGI